MEPLKSSGEPLGVAATPSSPTSPVCTPAVFPGGVVHITCVFAGCDLCSRYSDRQPWGLRLRPLWLVLTL